MAEGLLALRADGKRRLNVDGQRVLADADTPCCCCGCEDLPSSFTLDGHLVTTGGVSPCETDFTVTLNQDPEVPCNYSGTVWLEPCASFYPFTLKRMTSPCRWELSPFAFTDVSTVTRDSPVGAFPDVSSSPSGVTTDYTSLVIS